MFTETAQDSLSSNDKQKVPQESLSDGNMRSSATADRKCVLLTPVSLDDGSQVASGTSRYLSLCWPRDFGTPLLQLKGTFLVTNLNWETDPHLVFICHLQQSQCQVEKREGAVCPFVPMGFTNLPYPWPCEKTIVYSWAFHLSNPSLGAKTEHLTWERRLNIYWARPGALVSPSTEVRCFYLTSSAIYISEELKDHLPGFWRYRFSCKLRTVRASDCHVAIDNWILRLANRPARHYCRSNWSSHSFTMPLSPWLTVCCWQLCVCNGHMSSNVFQMSGSL